jgi:hypothetical protein
MKGRDNMKRVEFCPWFREKVTGRGEDILDVTLL